ncbi:dispanin subfamily A member 2b-like [Rana temporaria]|uniref:dispanin subfamily A member 2b-like n=1 Tax=Rana temporaria TaxID=8407 RepID=UPI001AADE720|nr:dispanin subfamily A member 2b-like [Rana temporaria]
MESDTKNSYEHASPVINVQPEPVARLPQHKDYLIWSICSMICCFFPIGIAALIFSVKTRDAIYLQNDTVAAKHSRTTYQLNIASSVIGIVMYIVVFILYFVIGMQIYHKGMQ